MAGRRFHQMPAHAFTRDADANPLQPLIVLERKFVVPRGGNHVQTPARTNAMRGTFEAAHEEPLEKTFRNDNVGRFSQSHRLSGDRQGRAGPDCYGHSLLWLAPWNGHGP